MKILISNDDGVFAEGMRTLSQELAKEHEVYICVPDRERSATGHSMSLHKPLMVDPLREMHLIPNVKNAYVTSGTPADCVKVALGAVWRDVKFDLMISGINHGPNLGVDVLYSGTVSAAMESTMLGVPSIATSLYSYTSKDFSHAAKWVTDYIKNPPDIPKNSFLNINIPPGPIEEYVGVEITKLGNRSYQENYEERQDPRGRRYYWLAGVPIEENEKSGMDGKALLENKVSITPVVFDMTYYDQIDILKKGLK